MRPAAVTTCMDSSAAATANTSPRAYRGSLSLPVIPA